LNRNRDSYRGFERIRSFGHGKTARGTDTSSSDTRRLDELRAAGKSQMPEGLEQHLTAQDVGDLPRFLERPDARLLLLVEQIDAVREKLG